MSMQRGCEIVEREAGQWFCVVALQEHDYDFRKFAVYGPATTEDEAYKMMSDRESNPGSSNTFSHEEMTPEQRRRIDDLPKRRWFAQRQY